MTTELTPGIENELADAMQRLLAGVRDRKAMQKSCERMDGIREEIRKKHGVLDFGLTAIRELRDE
jgi:hypothetical protein